MTTERVMTEFEAQVLADLSVLKNQRPYCSATATRDVSLRSKIVWDSTSKACSAPKALPWPVERSSRFSSSSSNCGGASKR